MNRVELLITDEELALQNKISSEFDIPFVQFYRDGLAIWEKRLEKFNKSIVSKIVNGVEVKKITGKHNIVFRLPADYAPDGYSEFETGVLDAWNRLARKRGLNRVGSISLSLRGSLERRFKDENFREHYGKIFQHIDDNPHYHKLNKGYLKLTLVKIVDDKGAWKKILGKVLK